MQQGKDELRSDVERFREKLTELEQNEAVKRAREVLAKAREDVLRQNAAIVADVRGRADAVKQAVGTVAGKVSQTISTAAQPVRDLGDKIRPYVPDISESEVVKRVSKTAAEAEEKILENTNVYQYGGFKTKEQRDKSLRAREPTPSADPGGAPSSHTTSTVEADPQAGSSVVVHRESRWASKWNNFVDNSRLLQRVFGVRRAYEESNNIFVYFAREVTNSIADRFAALFSETETARAMREVCARDPSFHIERFMKFVTEHAIPEILDALLTGDMVTLRVWCGEAMLNVLKANFETQLRAAGPGARLEGRILDMRHVELVTAKLLDETPVTVFSFNTQQISYIRGAAGQIIEGAEDRVENVLYVMALAKEELPATGVPNPVTQGWKLVELAIRDRHGAW